LLCPPHTHHYLPLKRGGRRALRAFTRVFDAPWPGGWRSSNSSCKRNDPHPNPPLFKGREQAAFAVTTMCESHSLREEAAEKALPVVAGPAIEVRFRGEADARGVRSLIAPVAIDPTVTSARARQANNNMLDTRPNWSRSHRESARLPRAVFAVILIEVGVGYALPRSRAARAQGRVWFAHGIYHATYCITGVIANHFFSPPLLASFRPASAAHAIRCFHVSASFAR